MDRLKVFQILIFVLAAIILLRLFYWQFISKIESASSGPISQDEIPASRGEIITSDGFALVTNQQAFLLYAKPQEVKGEKEVSKTISPYLISEKYATSEASLSEDENKQKEEEIKVKEQEVENRLLKKQLSWVQLARKLTLALKDTIKGKKIEGLGFEQDSKRFYPEASMAAQLLGFVGSDKFGQDTGYFGLEGYYDRNLKGKPGKLGQENDPLGIPILVGNYKRVDPEPGSSLHLSIDRVIQYVVEERLKADVEKYGAKSGTVIVQNPKTGRILALASYPNYDPSLREEFNQDLYKSPAVADVYEPGSTFKLITMSAGIELGLVTPQTKCDVCSGPRQIGGYEISTWNKKYYPNTTMSEVIQHSDNIGMTFVAQKLGIAKFYDFILKFGFSKPTGVDLQEESAGTIREKQDWREIDLATASFGQGIAVTPIQMVQAVGAIANRGLLISPKIVDKIVDSKGQEQKVKPEKEEQVISPKTAAQITEMMVNAVKNGEAQYFAPKGYDIAGKTGTAQIPVAGHYDPTKTIASFIGFAPANDPEFVMLVRFTEPTSSPYGAETAAPTFFAIAQRIFNYLGIPKNS